MLRVIDEADLHARQQTGLSGPRSAEKRQQHGSNHEQQHQRDATAVGQVAERFLVQQRS